MGKNVRNEGMFWNEEHLDKLVNMVWKDPLLWESICSFGCYDKSRLELLYQIVQRIVQENWEGTEEDIFRYGSMLHKEDLAARQIFLWLLYLSAKKTATIPCHHKEKGIL